MNTGKTLGEIGYDSCPDDGGKSNFGPWESAPQVVRDVHERMAKAIEKEIRRRDRELSATTRLDIELQKLRAQWVPRETLNCWQRIAADLAAYVACEEDCERPKGGACTCGLDEVTADHKAAEQAFHEVSTAKPSFDAGRVLALMKIARDHSTGMRLCAYEAIQEAINLLER